MAYGCFVVESLGQLISTECTIRVLFMANASTVAFLVMLWL